MPWADSAQQQLPYQSGSDTSHEGARHARRSSKTERDRAMMRSEYARMGHLGVTDGEMVARTGLPVNIVTARRNELQCVAVGRRRGTSGVTVTAWALEVVR